ncbi:response regulator [Paenibacillus typhae]|uniref:Two-component system, response regulator YesN n=1 Tax=Paenibacillus typhae TaxID=1174501 RepID=A0A1G8I7C8_9BACL|nr:response regulator [Paenibacillus typhae]SDI14823.1 two-component system, response regulator YesN [Paenibacillus typhae]
MHQILLVDDEPYVVDDLSISLPWTEMGFGLVHKAYSGYEALDLLQRYPIDIVVTDINMPEISGIELIASIRSRWKHIRVVMLTGYAEFEYARKAIEEQASAYLLKPIANDQLVAVITKLQNELRGEWEAWSSYQRTMQTFREHLPLLRDRLLGDLLQGRKLSGPQLQERLAQFDLPLSTSQPVCLAVVRPEEFFRRQDMRSMLLFEYAIINIAQELFQDRFRIWSCKDVHDYLVFLLQPREDIESGSNPGDEVAQSAYQLQNHVSTLIGGGLSVVTTGWGGFPDQVYSLYQSAISAIRQHIGSETGIYLDATDTSVAQSVEILQPLYEPPLLSHMFEANNWQGIEDKLNAITTELGRNPDRSLEHIHEARLHLETAFYYFAHKNNKMLSEIVGNPLLEQPPFQTPDKLREWALHVILLLREHFESERRDSRTVLIQSVHEYINSNLHYVSLQAIADHVQMHPVYLSKMYKLETGKRISDYIGQAKMEKAAYLLIHTPLKIYEVSAELGYSNAHYFIKLFKEYTGMTPQEYRDRAL